MNALDLEIAPVDITPYKAGNTGVDYVHRFDSGQPGPHVLVNALTHGNELCGAHVMKQLLDDGVRPRRGVLTLSFANVAAYQAFDCDNPTASRYVDEDFNRLWSPEILSGPRRSAELDRARELWPFVAGADYLLDVHSMQMDGPALMLAGTADKGRTLAHAVGVPAFIIADAGHPTGPRMRDFEHFAEPGHPRTALLVECGQHWRRSSVAVGNETVLRFLLALDVVAEETVAGRLPATPPPAQRVIEVTDVVLVTNPDFAFLHPFAGLEVIAVAGTPIAREAGREILTPYENCVLVMPSRSLRKGHTAVRLGRFVD